MLRNTKCPRCAYNEPVNVRARTTSGSGQDMSESTIGSYELRGELGRGAMARVWRAWDPGLRREVAKKFSGAFIIAFRGDEKMDVNAAIAEWRKKKK